MECADADNEKHFASLTDVYAYILSSIRPDAYYFHQYDGRDTLLAQRTWDQCGAWEKRRRMSHYRDFEKSRNRLTWEYEPACTPRESLQRLADIAEIAIRRSTEPQAHFVQTALGEAIVTLEHAISEEGLLRPGFITPLNDPLDNATTEKREPTHYEARRALISLLNKTPDELKTHDADIISDIRATLKSLKTAQSALTELGCAGTKTGHYTNIAPAHSSFSR